MRYLYTFFLYLSLPVFLIRLLIRSAKNKHYLNSILPRLGIIKNKGQEGKELIWLHAVSVGEVQAASPLIEYLLDSYKQYQLLVTTTTLTGKIHLQRLFGNKVIHEFFPYDLPFVINSFFSTYKPQKLIVLETEIWPNLYRIASEYRTELYLINARLSEKSFNGYARFHTLISRTLNYCAAIGAQFENDVRHLKALGADKKIISKTGNLKYDIKINNDDLVKGHALRESWKDKQLVWIAASTHEGEESVALEVHLQVLTENPDAILILAPRHPERSDKLLQTIDELSLTVCRSSVLKHENILNSFQVLLVDELGQLMTYFAASDITFVGGSLVPHGGHNLLEPACIGLPILTGSNLRNFQQISELLLRNESLIVVNTAQELFKRLQEFQQDKEKFKAMGMRAKQSYLENRGSMQNTVNLLNLKK